MCTHTLTQEVFHFLTQKAPTLTPCGFCGANAELMFHPPTQKTQLLLTPRKTGSEGPSPGPTLLKEKA